MYLHLEEETETHEEVGVVDRYVDLLSDPAHWTFELTLMFLFDIIVGLALWPLIKRAVRRHDKKHHDHNNEDCLIHERETD